MAAPPNNANLPAMTRTPTSLPGSFLGGMSTTNPAANTNPSGNLFGVGAQPISAFGGGGPTSLFGIPKTQPAPSGMPAGMSGLFSG